MYSFKMTAKNESLFRANSHVTKIWKTTFSKEFFNKIWLKVREHEKGVYYVQKVYTAWIRIEIYCKITLNKFYNIALIKKILIYV